MIPCYLIQQIPTEQRLKNRFNFPSREMLNKQGFPGRTYKPFFPIAQIVSSKNIVLTVLLLLL